MRREGMRNEEKRKIEKKEGMRTMKERGKGRTRG